MASMLDGMIQRGREEVARRAHGLLTNAGAPTADERTLWTADDAHHAYATLYDKLCELVDQQAELLRIMRRKDTRQLPIVIGGNTAGGANNGAPYRLTTEGYRHSRIFVSANVTITLSDPAGATLALTAGWNLLDLRDGCELTAPNNTNALLELTDELVVR